MFKVGFKEAGYSWNSYTFEFDTLEEAQEFASKAIKNNVDDGKTLEVVISYYEALSTGEEEEEE